MQESTEIVILYVIQLLRNQMYLVERRISGYAERCRKCPLSQHAPMCVCLVKLVFKLELCDERDEERWEERYEER